ncbi:MAG: nicotinamide riboside transporter PnuC [Bacteroidota bacterium]|nr:nicotinamide riboside transporter PnuC [Bacteroidota bacterium]
MPPVFDFLFGQYSGYASIDIVLEITGVLFGLLSVWNAKKNNIWVYPTGMISTSIFVYLLFKFAFLGDMIINAYYFIMSAYGWYYWSKREEQVVVHPITSTTKKEFKTALLLFVASLLCVIWIYQVFDKWKDWTAYVDTLTTAIFFVGMGLMARRKIEHWLFWILGDIISIPLYFYKGLTLTSLQYVIFTLIAIYGYRSWKKTLYKTPPISSG